MKVSAVILKELFDDSHLVQEPAEFVERVVTHLWEHAEAKSVAVVLQDLDPTHEVLALSSRGLSGQSMLALAGFAPHKEPWSGALEGLLEGAIFSVVPLLAVHQRLTLIADGETDADALVLVANIIALAVERDQALSATQRIISIFNRGPVVLYRRRNEPEWPIDEVSANVTREFGWPVEALLGHSCTQMVHPEDLPRVREEVKAALAQGTPCLSQGYRLINPAGLVREIFEFTHFFRDATGAVTHLHGYLFDDSERRRSEQEKAARLEQLQQSRKLEAIGTLASGIAHDLNNVLAVILSSLELARLESAPEAADADLVSATQAAMKGREMVRQLLAFGQSAAGARVPRDLQKIIQDSLRQVRSILPEGVALNVTLDPAALPVLADAAQLEQLLLNLVTNAVSAMPRGGALDITLRSVKGPRERVELEVKDTGEGMTAEVLSHAFEPFFTTRPVGKGIGLGLAMVHAIARKHEGTVALQSTPGRGTTVVVSFPCVEQPESAAKPEPRAVAAPARVGRVAVVDDETEVAHSTQRLISHFGYAVTALPSAAALLSAFEKQPDAFDLVLTDQRMPEMTGIEMAQSLRAHGVQVPILLVTGLPAEVDRGAVSAPFAVLGKPYRMEELGDAIASLLERAPTEEKPGLSVSGLAPARLLPQ